MADIIQNSVITENQLDEWVRGNARDAQGLIVELVYRLVAAASPSPRERRFPLGDSIGQPGPDGYLDADFAFKPFVPEGKSFWEIGTGTEARAKATADYRELTSATPEDVRRQSTFVFVTPLSGRRDWQFTWKEDAIAKWVKSRRERKEWQDVRVVDGAGLIDWLRPFPAVERWLASHVGLPGGPMQTPEQRWDDLKCIGDPPPLGPQVFLANRDEACTKLKDLFSGATRELKLDTRYPNQAADFVAAYIAALEGDAKVDAVGRCLIVGSAEAWNAATDYRDAHILVADFDLDDPDVVGTRLLAKARRMRHAVIYGGMPGGLPHPNRAPIPNPKTHQLKEALEKAGYKEERARILAQKSGGNLNSLLRCLQNLSLMPEWAQGTQAAELAIAEILGAWREDSDADKAVAERLTGNSFGEWIGKIREMALRPGTPLIQHDGAWKVVARYEGWYALGPRLFDEHLDRLLDAAIGVLREIDPQFELPSDQRFAASVHGKVLTHSRLLRNGLAESLALLGSHPDALPSCSHGKPVRTAGLAVKGIFADADWTLWASLNDLLPLLAEASPEHFLEAVEGALGRNPCPFDQVFSQEGSGLMGSNYMTGLLWALETLAWDPEYLTRVVVLLGELAAKDPGGNWANRPSNSLTTILLPWLPQTCASLEKRKAAVATLLSEAPHVAWKLLLDLLPQSHQTSFYSRKPIWREMIPEEWSTEVTYGQYWEQVAGYADLAISAAQQDLQKLAELIAHFDELPPPASEKLVAHLRSDAVVFLPEESRFHIWSELVDLVMKHRKFSEAEWAMEPEMVNQLWVVAESIAPSSPLFTHRRLFSDREFDLMDLEADYDEQHRLLDERRITAVNEVFAFGGVKAVLEFAQAVESSWRVGVAFGNTAPDETDSEILPHALVSEAESVTRFAGGYVLGRFRSRGWSWVDAVNTDKWTPSQIGEFLALLPFTSDTWARARRLLGADESPYWCKANANPYEAADGLEMAINHLVQFGRAHSAIRCLSWQLHRKQPLNRELALAALKEALRFPEGTLGMDVHSVVEVIQALQSEPNTNPEDLFRVEWGFLPLLDGHHGAKPKLLEQYLAEDPAFFCEVIRTVFRSKKDRNDAHPEPTDEKKSIAKNAYRLLSRWNTPPGTQRDGTFDGNALNEWLERVKADCEASGHLEVALSRIGHVLRYAPPDPDGLWIHHAAATVLNAKDVDSMRDGFRVELFNSRGMHSLTGGQAERELASYYRLQADQVEGHGYHRLATALRELAGSYDHDAEREANRDLFEDD